jgi:hypothetical protein
MRRGGVTEIADENNPTYQCKVHEKAHGTLTYD